MALPVFQITNHHLCLVAGVGLIGQQVVECLSKSYCLVSVKTTAIDWRDSKSLIAYLQHVLAQYKPGVIDVVWSAGKAGFAASDHDMEQEYQVYRDVMQFLNDNTVNLRVNLLSSAGGIYENTPYVDTIEAMSPSRPYACWKLKQEEFLYQLGGVVPRIYRIASVYGFKREQSRAGLINVMLDRSRSRNAVVVYGNQNTLRDYIFHRDIARYIVQDIVSESTAATKIIASGRATSISELINMITRIIGKRVKVFYLDNGQNSNDIVFSPHIIPADLQLTSLEEGIRLLYARG